MEKFSLHATDSSFRTSTKPQEYDNVESAQAAGIRSAAAIANDEIIAGAITSAVEVCVENSHHDVVDRSVVNMSVSKLQIDRGVVDPD